MEKEYDKRMERDSGRGRVKNEIEHLISKYRLVVSYRDITNQFLDTGSSRTVLTDGRKGLYHLG